jgi:hypothetical protein
VNTVARIVSAVQEGRFRSAATPRLREWRQRKALGQWYLPNRRLPSIHWIGDFSASRESTLLRDSFSKAMQGVNTLPKEIRSIEGMSGQRYRTFINILVATYSDARYLEIGSWAGSTVTAALHGNHATALCIDNWSQFDGPRSTFFANIEKIRSKEIDLKILEQDFRSVDYHSVGLFNIYLFDGPHEELDQYDGIMLAQPALLNPFVLIVDDWNWRRVRLGTFGALLKANCRIEASIEVRTTLDNSHPRVAGKESDWHNGYFIGIIRKSPTQT